MKSIVGISNIIFIAMVICLGCTEVYNPDLELKENIMFVEGTITDVPGKHTIYLRYTANYNEKAEFSPVKDARVTIIENDEVVHFCNETQEGVFTTDSTFFGKPGQSYVLRVETGDGNTFQSRPQRLPEINLPVERVYGQKEVRTVDYYNNYGEYLLQYKDVNQVYVDIASAEVNTYYRFETQSTIEDAARLKVRVGSDIDLVPLYQWNTYKSEDISLIEVNTQLDIVSKIPLTYLEVNPEEFSELKYQFEEDILEAYDSRIRGVERVEVETDTGIIIVDSIMYGLPAEIDDFDIINGWILQIHQYSISKDAYIFWSDMKKLEEITGEIFDPIATQLRGNMYCLTDDNIEMLGLFEVASKITTPAFINFYPTNDIFLSKMIDEQVKVPVRGWQDSIPPPFWMDKIQSYEE